MERSLFSLFARTRLCCCNCSIKDYRNISQTVNYCTFLREVKLVKVKMKIETFHDVRKRRLSRTCSDSERLLRAANGDQRISTMATIIDGKKISQDIQSELKEEVSEWIAKGNRKPHLTAVLVGEDPASEIYVRNKMTAAKNVGIDSETKRLPPTISEDDLLAEIKKLNEDPNVDGIIVQLPVPPHIDEYKVCNAVCPQKDVDGFNEVNIGRLCLDVGHLIPCTPLGVYELLRRYKIDTFGKNAVVVGRSKHIGMPMAMLLHTDGKLGHLGLDATVTICHRYTPPEELKKHCLQADIIVVATGIPHLIKADMVKPGACVIDVGITRIKDPEGGKDKLVGDVDFENVKKVAGSITPVPGGVGPMTVAMLLKNTLLAAKHVNN